MCNENVVFFPFMCCMFLRDLYHDCVTALWDSLPLLPADSELLRVLAQRLCTRLRLYPRKSIKVAME